MRPCAVARRLRLALAVLCLAGGAPLSGADTAGRIEAPPRAGLELRGVALVTSQADANVATPLAFAFDYLAPEKDKDRGLTFGAVVERRGENDVWVEIPPEDLAIEMQRFPPRGATERSGTRMLVTPRAGLPAGSYRVHVSALLPGESEAAAINKVFAWQVLPQGAAAKSGGDVPPLSFDTSVAASDTVGGRFPGGQNLGFHGAWTDPVTGFVYLRNRWYDPRNGPFLSPDPRGPVDSPNLYAFVGHQPTMYSDPLGECLGLSDVPCSRHADQLHEAVQRRFPKTGHRGIDAWNHVGEAILLLPADAALRLGEGLGRLHGRLEGMASGHVPPMRSAADLRREANAAALDLAQAAGDVGALYGAGKVLASVGASAEALPAIRGLLKEPAPQPPATGPWITPGDLLPDGRIAGIGPGAALRDSPEFASISGRLSRGEVGELLGRPDVRFASTVEAGAARPPRHHLFVQDHREWFRAHDVDIDRYTMELGVGEHTAVHTMGFNQRWDEFVAAEASRSTPYSTREVLAFGAKLRRDFKLEGHPLVPFKD